MAVRAAAKDEEVPTVHLDVISPKRLAEETRGEARDAHTLTPKKARSTHASMKPLPGEG